MEKWKNGFLEAKETRGIGWQICLEKRPALRQTARYHGKRLGH